MLSLDLNNADLLVVKSGRSRRRRFDFLIQTGNIKTIPLRSPERMVKSKSVLKCYEVLLYCEIDIDNVWILSVVIVEDVLKGPGKEIK